MHYGNIKQYDIADGEGVRISLFVSGCTNHCKDCFQPQTWDFSYGQEFTDETQQQILDFLKFELIDGLTVLGGEPFEPENQRVLVHLLKKVKEEFPSKNIWCYTGFVLEKDLLDGGRKHCEVTDEMLSYIDILVDGPFITKKKNISLKFRGSENQRVLDLPKTLETGSPVLHLQ